MWKITEHRHPKGQQELKVKVELMEIVEYNTHSTYAKSLIDAFKRGLKEVPRTNNYSADLFYKMVEVNSRSVEVWKTGVTGDDLYKIWSLNYEK
jgi:hypothetical protein